MHEVIEKNQEGLMTEYSTSILAIQPGLEQIIELQNKCARLWEQWEKTRDIFWIRPNYPVTLCGLRCGSSPYCLGRLEIWSLFQEKSAYFQHFGRWICLICRTEFYGTTSQNRKNERERERERACYWPVRSDSEVQAYSCPRAHRATVSWWSTKKPLISYTLWQT